MPTLCSHKECTGCATCFAVCPQHAISMEKDIYKPQKQNAHFGKNKMPPKCDKLSSILTFQTAFKFL